MLIGAAVAVAVVAAAVLALRPSSSTADAAAPSFSLSDLRAGGRTVSLAQRDGRPAVVNFFAAWCEPCKKELPVFADAARRHGGTVTFIGVDEKDSRDRAIDLLESSGVRYPAAYDPDGNLVAPYRLGMGLPVTVFVGADGRIRERHLGALKAPDLDARIRRLLAAS